MNELRTDNNRDVVEAIEQSEFKLLQKKKNKEEDKIMFKEDADKVETETKLLTREAKEEEERKKKLEEEEELKFDF